MIDPAFTMSIHPLNVPLKGGAMAMIQVKQYAALNQLCYTLF